MRILALLSIGLILIFGYASAQTVALNACDLNADGADNVVDVQLATNMSIGLTPCPSTVNVAGLGVCNIVVVQRVIDSVLGGACVTGTGTSSHSVTLNWTASTSPTVVGYNVLRSTTAGGPYTLLNSSPVAAPSTTYTDTNVQAGTTYYYVAAAVDNNSVQSTYSNQATAVIPTP